MAKETNKENNPAPSLTEADSATTIAPVRTFRVIWSGITNAAGQLSREGDLLTAEEVGNVELHLGRGAIIEIQPDPVVA